MTLPIKLNTKCRFDLVALGEVMLRFDPGEDRISTARSFRVCEGGGEYNVARGLKRCFGLETAIVTALVDNPIGFLVQDLLFQGGVNQSYVRWIPHDGVGRSARNGLNFTERGFGLRGAVGCSDRGHTAVSQMKPGDVPWDAIFGDDGVRWFHTGGVFAGLSESTAAVAEEAIKAAKKHGAIVSYDLNYRDSLWKSVGGPRRAQQINGALAAYVDVMIGNEEDFTAALGFPPVAGEPSYSTLDPASYERMLETVAAAYPNLAIVAATLRQVKTASRNDWGAVAFSDGHVATAAPRRDVEVLDRIGSGDSFASGLIYGLLTGRSLQWALECGAAHGALAMTTRGDTSMATFSEVQKAMSGLGTRVER
jgi:2-dehydro-3-deoxygluconokinase